MKPNQCPSTAGCIAEIRARHADPGVCWHPQAHQDVASLLAEVDRLNGRIDALQKLRALRLTRAQQQALYHCLHMEEHGMRAGTGRTCKVKTMRELAKLGLVESAGFAALADGDGFIIYPERYAECWKPTDAGRKFRSEI